MKPPIFPGIASSDRALYQIKASDYFVNWLQDGLVSLKDGGDSIAVGDFLYSAPRLCRANARLPAAE